MNKRQRIFSYSLTSLVLLLFILSGCKTSKIASKKAAVRDIDKEEFFDRYIPSTIDFKYLNARLNVEIDVEKKQFSSRVNLKMIKDEAFQLSVQPFLGLEAFRLVFGTDQVLIIDRVNKYYLLENYHTLKGKLPVGFNYHSLQSLFTNRLFAPNREHVTMNDLGIFDMRLGEQKYILSTKDAMDIQYQFYVDGEDKLLSTQLSDESGKYQFFWNYKDFKPIEHSKKFPMGMNADFLINGLSKGKLKINYSKLETSSPVEIDFKIPSKYTRVSYETIMRSLIN